MSQGPLAEAAVEIVADTSKLDDGPLKKKIEQSLQRAARKVEGSLDDVAEEARKVGDAVGDSLEDGAARADKALKRVSAQAAKAGRDVKASLGRAAEDAARALGDVGAKGLADVQVEAERASRTLTARLTSAARLAGRAVDANVARSVEQLRRLSRVAADVGDRVAAPFERAGLRIAAALNPLSSGLSWVRELPARAAASARAVAGEFVQESEVARRALARLGGISFEPVISAARSAASQVGAAFSAAAGRSRAALAGIGSALYQMRRPIGYTVAGIGILGAAIAGFGLVSAGRIEQTQIAFTALLGSAREASAYMRELQQFAASTPFEFEGLADSARRLLAMGEAAGITRKEILPTLTTIGDIAAVLGAGQEEIDGIIRALGQMASKGRVSMEELHQISERLPGFSAVAAIAEAQGISTAEAMAKIESGAMAGRDGIEAILQGMKEFPGAAGAMEAQAQTLLGVFSKFKDETKIALTEAFQPIIPVAKQTISMLTPVISSAVSTIGPALGQVIGALGPFLSHLTSAAAPVLAQVFALLATALRMIAPILPPVIDAFGQILAVLRPLMAPVGAIANLLGTVLAAGLQLLASILLPVTQALSGPLTSAINQLTPLFSQLAAAIAPVAAELGAQLAPILPQLLPPLLELVQALAELLIAVLPILPPIIELAGVLLNLLVAKALVPLLNLIVGAITKLLGVVTSIIGPIATFVGSWDLSKAWASVKNFVSQTLSTLGTLASDAITAGKNFISGLISGIGSMVGSLVSAARNAAASALNSVKSFLGIFSPSRKYRDVGRDSMRGWIAGIVKNSPKVTASARKVAKDVLAIAKVTGKDFGRRIATADARDIDSIFKDLVSKIRQAFRGLNTRVDDRLVARIKTANRQLRAVVRERDQIIKRIEEATKFAEQVTGRALDFAGIVGLGGGDRVMSPQGLESVLQERLRQIRRFQGDLAALARRGLGDDLIRQLATAGPEQAGALARSLTTASNATLASLSRLNRDIRAQSKSLGEQVADELYDSGRAAGKGFLDGLREQQAAIEKLMERIARGVADSVKKSLKIRSPSRVMEDLGDDTGLGFFRGLEQWLPQLEQLMGRLARAPQTQMPRAQRPIPPARYGETAGSQVLAALAAQQPRSVREVHVQAPITVHMYGADPRAVGDYIESRIVAAIR